MITWFWPQYYFLFIYVLSTFIYFSNALLAREDKKKVENVFCLAFLAFAAYTLHVGGFW